jgi:hypothetical protein
LQDWLCIRLGGRVRWALREAGAGVVLFTSDEQRLAVPVKVAVLRRADAEGELERDVREAWLAARARPGEWVRADEAPAPKAEKATRGRKPRAAGATAKEGLTNSA